jgi:hypothetical protein
MSDIQAEFAALKSICPAATLHAENDKPMVVLPDFKFRTGVKTVQMPLLLHPSQHSGYVTRLFFGEKLEGAGASQNWTSHILLSRKWWAPSWNNVVPDQPWTSMLGAHLRAVA